MKLYKNIASAQRERADVEALKITVKGEEFPLEILDFPNLGELYLDGQCRRFPAAGLNWEKLRVLSIKWPGFSGDLSALFSLPCLENLKIIETPLKSFLLPLGFAAAPLKSLTIKDCGITLLPEEMSMLVQLTELNLSGNQLSVLPKSFGELRNLRRLNLDSNRFETFPDDVKRMPALGHLSIDQNRFSQEEKERIQREFHLWPA